MACPGAEILTILLDPDPAGRPIEPAGASWEGQAVPSPMSLLLRSAVRTALSPAHALRVGYELARSIPGLKPLQSLPALVGLGRDRDEFLSRPTLIAPRSLLNQPITAHRRWVFGEVPLETIKTIKTAADTTVNNVVISVSAGAVRKWMLEHGDLPERSLQALIPISIRTEEEQGDIGNKVSGMIAPIGTHLADPIERLTFVHHTMEIARETHQATPATLLQDFAQFAPPAIAARAARLAYRNGRGGRWTPFNLVISNVPGPHFPLYLAGAQLEGHYPVSAITDGAALNITLHSYLGQLCFGLIADRDLVPDLATILDSIQDEVAATRSGGVVKRPAILQALVEPARASGEFATSVTLLPFFRMLPRGDSHSVLVLPGFMASDGSTRPLRRLLTALGYRAEGWGLGRNMGPTERVVNEMPDLVDRLTDTSEGTISIVGWSLGGIFARHLAARTPELVRSVVTLGSPVRSEARRCHQCLTALRGARSDSCSRSSAAR